MGPIMASALRAACVCGAAVALASCADAARDGRAGVAVGPVTLDHGVAGLHNVFEVTPGVFSGSSPETREDFEALRALGVRTIVSVDGARPSVESARREGIRYVHLPAGYDGIDGEVARAAAAAIELAGPGGVYVHCHHGLHRGPAACATALVRLGRMTPESGEAFLRRAGTSGAYPGLWSSVRDAVPMSAAELSGAIFDSVLPEVSEVSGLVEGMIAIDAVWERLKLVRDAGWGVPAEHPDVVPAAEAGMLADAFRVLAEGAESRALGEDCTASLVRAAAEASALEEALASVDSERASDAFAAVAASCTDCHKTYRN